MWLYFTKNSIEMDNLIWAIVIQLKDPKDLIFADNLAKELEVVNPLAEVDNFCASVDESSDDEGIERIVHMLNSMFDFIILIIMFLCFFALSTNMSANILDQTKEIGTLRAMGWRKIRIQFLYFYEAMILVLSSSLQGVLIGMFVGYAFTLLITITQYGEMPFFFPTEQFLIIIAFSILFAGISTVGPAASLMKMEISSIFRKI